MAVMPGVDFRSIDLNGVPLMKKFDVVCVHTIVGAAPAPAAHFSTTGKGHIFQHRDTRFQSAANLDGNHRVIAIENADRDGEFAPWNKDDGHAVPAFTTAQCESIARIIAWVHQTHDIPIELCPDSRPGSRGVAYHRLGIDGNFGPFAFGGRVPNGEKWSSSFGKVCPGDRRIRQLIDVIIPRARVLAGTQEEDIMATLADVQAAVRAEFTRVWPGNVPGTRLPGRLGAGGLDDQYGWTLNAAGFAATAASDAAKAVKTLSAQRAEIAGLTAAVGVLATALAKGDEVTADQLRTAVHEAITKVAAPIG